MISKQTREEIATKCQVMLDGLNRIMQGASASLKLAFEASDRRAESDGGSKFNIVPPSCGRITDFQADIQERIGVFVDLPILVLNQSIQMYQNTRGTDAVLVPQAMLTCGTCSRQ